MAKHVYNLSISRGWLRRYTGANVGDFAMVKPDNVLGFVAGRLAPARLDARAAEAMTLRCALLTWAPLDVCLSAVPLHQYGSIGKPDAGVSPHVLHKNAALGFSF